MNQRQLQVIDYLREENRVLREQLGGRRVRLNDDQRRRLAVRAKALVRKILFPKSRSKLLLGPLWALLPAGGLNHDPYGYLKSEGSATRLVSAPLELKVRL
jgi:hypothetical protein